jgi:hypothetical protein
MEGFDMLVLNLSDNLRIRDLDANQYVLERPYHAKGEVVWQAVAWCGTIKGLLAASRRLIANDASNNASRVALEAFDNKFEATILALPPKNGRK